MTGFIAMQREALDHPLLQDAERFRAWFWLVANAVWKPTPYDVSGKIITLDRGQLCVSVRQLAQAWGWSKSTVDRFLTRLKTETMIGTQAGTGRLVITICNYDKYQSPPTDSGTPSGTLGGTAAGQQRDIKEQGNKETSTTYPDGYVGDDTQIDPAKVVFETGHEILKDAGHADPARRGRIIGNWRKQFGDDDRLIDTLSRCIAMKPREPISWVNANIARREPSNDANRRGNALGLPRDNEPQSGNPYVQAAAQRQADRAAAEQRDADPWAKERRSLAPVGQFSPDPADRDDG